MARPVPSITKKDISSLRSTLEYFREAGELLASDAEIDPHLELAAIQKRLDGGPPMLFERVKGYPNARLANNLYASADRIARLFGAEDARKFKFKAVDAIRQPLPPIEVKDAPCQEVVVTESIDVWDRVPMISHSHSDPGRTLGAGNTVVRGRFFWGGSHIGYNRMNFRGPDFSSFQISPGSHMDMVATHWYHKEPIPMTINIGVPPACTMMAGSGFTYMILPKGADELGVAGALQGFPVEMVKAKTVEAWSIANAEYVIEGYLDTTQKVWESPLAEKDGKQGVYPFHPEWAGYMGKAYRTYRFQATAITHRRDKPIYYGLIVHGMDDHYIDVSMREAAFLEVADRISPGFCVDTHIPMGLTDWGGVAFQVKKRRARDEGLQRNILTAALSISLGMKLAIAVDEDIDIYEPEDLLWALATRTTPESIQTVCAGGFGQTFQPSARSTAGERDWTQSNIRFQGGLAIDATVPFVYKEAFERARYDVELVDLSKWFTAEQIERARAAQKGYARWMAERGNLTRLGTARLDLVSAPVAFVEAVVADAVEAAEALVGARLLAGWLGDPDVRAGLSIQLRALRVDPAEVPWRIRLMVLRDERCVIGSINVKGPPGSDGTVDMGWGVEPTYRGRGFATEAARAVLAWLLAQPDVRRVTARIQPENLPSIRVARRLGLRETAERHPEQGLIWEIVPP